jgi:uncharacterized membrane protein
MKSRTETAFRGWLYALPFVLVGPPVFWIVSAVIQKFEWSWPSLLKLFEYGVPIILFLIFAHLLVFLFFGLPLFFAFWGRKSFVWFLPVTLSIGILLAAIYGFSDYFNEGHLSWSTLRLYLGYGATTAVGCWFANKKANKNRYSSG